MVDTQAGGSLPAGLTANARPRQSSATHGWLFATLSKIRDRRMGCVKAVAMTGAQIRSAQIALERAIESGDDTTAEELSVLLAPHVEAQCEALDRDPRALIPAWETDR